MSVPCSFARHQSRLVSPFASSVFTSSSVRGSASRVARNFTTPWFCVPVRSELMYPASVITGAPMAPSVIHGSSSLASAARHGSLSSSERV
jgi:hypothetical protein